jgi:MFS family permease
MADDRRIIYILVAIVVVDMMGLGLVYPLLPKIFFQDSLFFQHHSLNQVAFYLAQAAWPLGIILGASMLGMLSDKFGRKRILTLSFLLTSLSYALAIFSLYFHVFSAFLISRLVCGFFSGNFEVAQAAALDWSEQKDRAQSLGYISMASSFGFSIGPLVVNVAGYTFPAKAVLIAFGIALCLSLISLYFIRVKLPNDSPKFPEKKINTPSLFGATTFICRDKRTSRLSWFYLMMQIGWGMYLQGLVFYLSRSLSFSMIDVSWVFMLMGITVTVFNVTVHRYLLKQLTLVHAYQISVAICALCMLISATWPIGILQWWFAPIAAGMQLLLYKIMLYQFSLNVTEKELGITMGSAGSGFGFGFAFANVLIFLLAWLDVTAPLYVGTALLIYTAYRCKFYMC